MLTHIHTANRDNIVLRALSSILPARDADMPTPKPSTSQKINGQLAAYATGRHLPFPPEIRDRIYKLVLAHENLPATVLQWSGVYPPGASTLAILLVSKQTFLEAFHIFYREGCITLQNTDMLYSFLKNIGYARRQQLTALEFSWEGRDPKQAFRLLKTCQNLRSLTIDVFTLGRAPPAAWQALREVRGLDYVHFRPAESINVPAHWILVGVSPAAHPAVRSRNELIQYLTEGMTRPRIKKYSPDPHEKIDLFKGKREIFKRSEAAELEAETAVLMANQKSWKAAGLGQLPKDAGTYAITTAIGALL